MFKAFENCSCKAINDSAGRPEYVGYWRPAPNTLGAPDEAKACYAVVKVVYDSNGNFESAAVTRNEQGDITFNHALADRASLAYT